MKTYLDMDEILRHSRRYIGEEYDEPYLVSAVPEEVIRSLPSADVVEVRHGRWIGVQLGDMRCSLCKEVYSVCAGLLGDYNYCPNCGAKMDGGNDK